MTDFWCHCDPHGDNARCNRECCQPRQFTAPKPKPSPEDMAEAVETLRMLASRVRGTAVAQTLARVAAWIEQETKPNG